MSDLARPGVVITATEFRGFALGAMHTELRERCPWVKEIITVGEQPVVDAMTWDQLSSKVASPHMTEPLLICSDPERMTCAR